MRALVIASMTLGLLISTTASHAATGFQQLIAAQQAKAQIADEDADIPTPPPPPSPKIIKKGKDIESEEKLMNFEIQSLMSD